MAVVYHSGMKPAEKLQYQVVAELALPKSEEERAFVRLERQYANRQLEGLAHRSLWSLVMRWLDRAPTAKQWRHYDHDLAQYEHKLARYEAEIGAGLVPVKFLVHYNGPATDRRIEVEVTVHEGRVRPAKKKPKRPRRIDREPARPWLGPGMLLGGFWRSDTDVTPHRLRATFSRLRPGEAAYVVNKMVHVQMSDQTRLHWRIRSKGLAEAETGEVLG
jgi:hypothetical protein